jgi:hypothetical protein
MICSNCNREIPEGSCFCGLCGHAAEQKAPGMRTAGFVAARTVGEKPMPITRGGGYESGELPEPEVRFSPGFGNNVQPAPKQSAPKAEFRCAACGAVLRELRPNVWKLSLRTGANGRVNATEACRLLGGGGHSMAAGATVEGTLEEAEEKILAAINAVRKDKE